LPPAFGIIRSRTGNGVKLRPFNWHRSSSRNSSTPFHAAMEPAVWPSHPGGDRTPVAPHPIPGNQQEARVGDEVEQVIV
jgi:hypothetical protein